MSSLSGTGRTLVISDTHLGRPMHGRLGKVTAARLRPLWIGCDRVVINGDVAELQMAPYRAEAARQIEDLHRFCEQDGVELTLISGNHDAMLTDRRHLTMVDGRVLLTHGDVLHPAVAPWCKTAGAMKRQTRSALAEVESPDLKQRLMVSQHVSHRDFLDPHVSEGRHGIRWMLMRPHKIATLLHYWAVVPQLASCFAEEFVPEAEVVMFGHSHREGFWTRGGRTIINTGSFGFPGKPWAVLVEGSCITVHRIQRDGEDFTRERTAKHVCELAPEGVGHKEAQKQQNEAGLGAGGKSVVHAT